MLLNAMRRARDLSRRFPVLHRTVRMVWTPPRHIRQHLYFDGRFKVPVEPGTSFQLQAEGEFIENELFWCGLGTGWEGNSLKTWIEFAKRSEYIVDVGANTGVYSMLAASVNRNANIIALEPAKDAYRRLKRNIALNGYSIDALNIAASDKSGDVSFYEPIGSGDYTASLVEAEGMTKTTVRAETLDSILRRQGFPRLDLIKIDVEMHEPAVLKGLRKTLERDHPTILMEILNGDVRRAVEEAIAGLGYVIEPVSQKDSPDPVGDARNFILKPRAENEPA